MNEEPKVEFIIPLPHKAWCHLCGRGFSSIETLQKHHHEVHVAKASAGAA